MNRAGRGRNRVGGGETEQGDLSLAGREIPTGELKKKGENLKKGGNYAS